MTWGADHVTVRTTNSEAVRTTSSSEGNARSLSLKALQVIEQGNTFADDVLDRLLLKTSFTTQDRALTFELVYGVLRHQETLDWRLNLVADRPVHRLPTPVLMALRLGAYQMLYLDKIPLSAAVNESVKLVKAVGTRDWTGFVNAVLRELARQPAPAWPDLHDDPITALSIRYSCQRWMIERWIARFGVGDAEIACRQTLRIPPLTLRANVLRCSMDELEMRFRQEARQAKRTEVSPVGLTLEKRGPVTDLLPFQEGWCYIEDEAAQLVPLLLDPKPGQRVLDVCAAPGGKTTHVAALMNNHGDIVALDQSPSRLRLLEENCRRLGVSIVNAFAIDVAHSLTDGRPASSRNGPLATSLSQGFDRVLVDAPCSGLGVLRRHPEAKWNKRLEQLTQHQAVQTQILNSVCRLLRPGGVLVYSACSTEPEETDDVIAGFCRQHPEFHHEAVTPWLPPAGRPLTNQDGDLMTMFTPYDMDGFFAARLRKVG